jgi:SHS2 domain-containing protein
VAKSGHELVEHTADEGLRVWAPSLDELFAEAAVGLIRVMGEASASETRSEEVRIDAPDLDALFVDFLSEVLFLFEARDIAVERADLAVSSEPWTATGTLSGRSADAFAATGAAVKAVTYHGLEIKRTETGYEAVVYLDV